MIVRMAPKRKREGSHQSINLVVGGLYFCLPAEVIERFPDSYFAHLLKYEWNADQTSAVHLDRDGEAFYHIHHYLQCGNMNPYRDDVEDLESTLAVKREADFYNLPELVNECDYTISGKIQPSWFDKFLVPGIFELFDCVWECETVPTDPIILAMAPWRLPTIATTRIAVSEPRINIAKMLQYIASETTWKLTDSLYYVASSYSARNIVQYRRMTEIAKLFRNWPLDNNHSIDASPENMYVYCTDGHSTNNTCFSQRFDIGRMVYILNSTFTGGAVSASVNGQTVSISQPGECMALAAGVRYGVDPVTSGVMVLVEFEVHRRNNEWDKRVTDSAPTLDWTVHRPFQHTQLGTSTSASDKLVQSIEGSLCEYCGLVLCLTNYYHIRHSDDENRRFETDPSLLTGQDAVLYELLCMYYEVSVVSVYVGKPNNQQQQACVLDFKVDSPTFSGSGDISDADSGVCGGGKCGSDKYKIVAPLFGCGARFQRCVDGASGKPHYFIYSTQWDTVLTALLVRRKEEV